MRKKETIVQGMGERLKQKRHERGWTQLIVAVELDITEQAVSQHERARHEPSLTELLKYAALYEISTDYLLKGVPSTTTKSISNDR